MEPDIKDSIPLKTFKFNISFHKNFFYVVALKLPRKYLKLRKNNFWCNYSMGNNRNTRG